MNYSEFERRAREMFETIPPDFRGGVEYVAVSRDTVPHPELPDVYTLGECATGELDLGMDFPAETRSGVHLYHGSFRALAEMDEAFDWEGELWETLTHEIRHHRESTAGEDALEEFDYAADENFKRREGLPYDPLFYRSGEPIGDDAWDVDGDRFAEVRIAPRDFERMDEIVAALGDETVSVPRPERMGDVCFLYLEGYGEGPGEAAVVLVRRRGAWESMRGLFGGAEPEVVEWAVQPGDWFRVER